jgi:hypothetical protein
MTMNPHNIFRPPTRWALRLQDWLWLGVSGVWRLLFYLGLVYLGLVYLGLVYLGQIGHPALGWSGNIKSDDSAKCQSMQDRTQPNSIRLAKVMANSSLNDAR